MSKGDFKPVVTIYDTETEYVTRKGFEKLMRRVKALEQALNARDEARGAAECACPLKGHWDDEHTADCSSRIARAAPTEPDDES